MRRTVQKDGPHPVDVHAGARVRLRRTLLGMSQETLGEAVNLTFQQIQKYERGTNRMGSSRLFEMSKVLDVSISFFFDDMPPEVSGERTGPVDVPAAELGAMAKRETLELVRAYYRIKNDKVRKRVFELAKALAKAEAPMAVAAE